MAPVFPAICKFGLRRAVSDYLQQPSTRESAQTLEVIEEYLSDARTLDAVYKSFIGKAKKEPYSPIVIGRAVSLLKQYLIRYQPSRETLQIIFQFCATTSDIVGRESPELQRSFLYIRDLLEHVISKLRSLNGAPLPSEDGLVSRVSSQGLSSYPIDPNDMGGSEYSDSHASVGGSGRNNNLVVSSGAGSSWDSEHLPQKRIPNATEPLSHQDEHYPKMFINSGGSPLLGAGWHMHAQNGMKGTISDTLAQEMMHYRLPLVWMPGVDGGGGSSGPIDEEGWLEVKGIQGVLCPEHLWTVAGAQKQQNEVDVRRSSSLNAGTPLFQYRHYMDQEHLNLNTDEVSAVLEGACGVKTAGTEENPIWDEEDEVLWDEPGPYSSIGQVCATIMVKLLIDMWVKCGPAVSYPLALRMLQQCLTESKPEARSRAFDILYNLSLHAEMLTEPLQEAEAGDSRSESAELGYDSRELRASSSKAPSSVGGGIPHCNTPLSERSSASYRLHPLREEPEDQSETRSRHTNSQTQHANQECVFQMARWLHVLMFDLLTLITQMGEETEVVWRSAMGCFLHLNTCNGYFMVDQLQSIPMKVLAKMLRKCREFGWSEELYSHLLRLPVHLLYVPEMQQADDGAVQYVVSEARFEQFGGMPELLFHLQNARSYESAGGLIRLVIDYAAKSKGCSRDLLTPLITGLFTPGAFDVVLTTCQHGHQGIAEIFLAAIQHCILEKNTDQDSPRMHVHCRKRFSESSMFSDTPSSSTSYVEPEALDSWKAVLCQADGLLCGLASEAYSHIESFVEVTKRSVKGLKSEMASSSDAWGYLRVLLGGGQEDRVLGVRWLADLLALRAEGLLTGGRDDGQVLLPEPPQVADSATPSNGERLSSLMLEWVTYKQQGKHIGFEFSMLVNRLMASLVAVRGLNDNEKSNGKVPTRPGATAVSKLLFGTLEVAAKWLEVMPESERQEPLLCISNHIFQVVHAPQPGGSHSHSSSQVGGCRVFSQSSASTSYTSPNPGSFLHWDFLVGAGAVYHKLLRMVPMQLMMQLINHLNKYSPAYQMRSWSSCLGFYGRPGFKTHGTSVHANVPWSDTVSDMRAALCLLLLRRYSIDNRKERNFRSMCERLMEDADVRVQYFASRHLLKQFMQEKREECNQAVRQFIAQAQERNDERLVDNPYLQVQHILEMRQRD